METKEYTTIDRVKAGWPTGPWDGEPDKVQWPDAATGLPCLAVRHSRSGHWCGYVGVTVDHPKFGKSYSDYDADVHGGLTFTDVCSPSETEATGICHTPAAGEPDHVWWFGFDCAQAWDYAPRDCMEHGYRSHDSSYKSLRFVQNECATLASQLREISE